MRLFRRRTPAEGRHALGAAVTGLPSAVLPVRPAAPVVPAVAAPVPATWPAPVPAAQPAPVPATRPAPVPAPQPASQRAPRPAAAPVLPSRQALRPAAPPAAHPARVQLGFRDGTSVELDPRSESSRALRELAGSLTRGG